MQQNFFKKLTATRKLYVSESWPNHTENQVFIDKCLPEKYECTNNIASEIAQTH